MKNFANWNEKDFKLRKIYSIDNQFERKEIRISNDKSEFEIPIDFHENIKKSSIESFGTKLFENFVIIGADPQELEEMNENNYKLTRITPKILCDFDCSSKHFEEKHEKYIIKMELFNIKKIKKGLFMKFYLIFVFLLVWYLKEFILI